MAQSASLSQFKAHQLARLANAKSLLSLRMLEFTSNYCTEKMAKAKATGANAVKLFKLTIIQRVYIIHVPSIRKIEKTIIVECEYKSEY